MANSGSTGQAALGAMFDPSVSGGDNSVDTTPASEVGSLWGAGISSSDISSQVDLGTGTPSTIGDALRTPFYETSDQYLQLQQELFASGFWTARRPPRYGDKTDIATYDAWKQAVIVAARSGMSVSDVLTQSDAGSTTLTSPRIPAVIQSGAVVHNQLSNPDTVGLVADAVAKQLLGRNATDKEKAAIVASLQGQETSNRSADLAQVQADKADVFQQRVDARNTQIPPPVSASPSAAQIAAAHTATLNETSQAATVVQGDNPKVVQRTGNLESSAAVGPSISGGIAQILATIKARESGDYDEHHNPGGATGAYQYEPATWKSQATEAGYAQYADRPAYLAPPEVQDAVAAHNVQAILAANNGDVSAVPLYWYLPAAATNASLMDKVPAGGNRLTPRQYQAEWMSTYQQQGGAPTGIIGAASGTTTAASGPNDYLQPGSLITTVAPPTADAATAAYLKANDNPEYQAHQLVDTFNTFRQLLGSRAAMSGLASPQKV